VVGKLGPETRSALRQFQQEKGIKANGKVTRQTLAALGVNTASNAATGNRQQQSGRAGYAQTQPGGNASQGTHPRAATSNAGLAGTQPDQLGLTKSQQQQIVQGIGKPSPQITP
jgi:peptidoglycan hydrolase-like protein with peptidoglycan-binding domain